jgi:hypothetical protein
MLSLSEKSVYFLAAPGGEMRDEPLTGELAGQLRVPTLVGRSALANPHVAFRTFVGI